MSYYEKSKIILTDHAITRISERLKIESQNLADLYAQIEKIYETSFHEFSVGNTEYYKIPDKQNLYFVIESESDKKVIITVTELNARKKIDLMNKIQKP